MKSWLWVPLAAVVGVMAGSWGPRSDIALLKARLAEARSAPKSSESVGFNAFTRLAHIPDVAKPPSSRPKKPKQPVVPATTNAAPAKAAAPTGSPKSPKDLRLRIDEAAELWRTRVELATVQWKEKLGIVEGNQSKAFDAKLGEMNAALRDSVQALADEIETSGKMSHELGVRVMGDVTRTMAETYDAIGDIVPSDRRNEVGELPMFEFVDPSVAEPLIGVQDKLDGKFMEKHR